MKFSGAKPGLIMEKEATHSITSRSANLGDHLDFWDSTDVRWMAAFGGEPDIDPAWPKGRV